MVVMTMATNNDQQTVATTGMMPAVNDLIAGAVVLGAYITRYGTIAEGVAGEWWLIPLILTTDLVLPLLGAIWILAVPTWSLYRRIES